MPAKKSPPSVSPFPISAIVSLDPAAVGPAGLAVRMTAPLIDPQRGRLRAPEFLFEGCVFSSTMHDDLTEFLAARIPRGSRVLLAVEDAIYGARGTARHLGRAIGAIESVLNDINVAEPKDTKYVFPAHWRRTSLPLDAKGNVDVHGREELKQAARDAVSTLYGLDVGPDLAEAILINDHIVLARPDLWSGAKPQQSKERKRILKRSKAA